MTTQHEDIKLKPCPFCGDPPNISTLGTWVEISCCVSMARQKIDMCTRQELGHFCENMSDYKNGTLAVKRVIEEWNTRTASLEGVKEVLEKAHTVEVPQGVQSAIYKTPMILMPRDDWGKINETLNRLMGDT